MNKDTLHKKNTKSLGLFNNLRFDDIPNNDPIINKSSNIKGKSSKSRLEYNEDKFISQVSPFKISDHGMLINASVKANTGNAGVFAVHHVKARSMANNASSSSGDGINLNLDEISIHYPTHSPIPIKNKFFETTPFKRNDLYHDDGHDSGGDDDGTSPTKENTHNTPYKWQKTMTTSLVLSNTKPKPEILAERLDDNMLCTPQKANSYYSCKGVIMPSSSSSVSVSSLPLPLGLPSPLRLSPSPLPVSSPLCVVNSPKSFIMNNSLHLKKNDMMILERKISINPTKRPIISPNHHQNHPNALTNDQTNTKESTCSLVERYICKDDNMIFNLEKSPLPLKAHESSNDFQQKARPSTSIKKNTNPRYIRQKANMLNIPYHSTLMLVHESNQPEESFQQDMDTFIVTKVNHHDQHYPLINDHVLFETTNQENNPIHKPKLNSNFSKPGSNPLKLGPNLPQPGSNLPKLGLTLPKPGSTLSKPGPTLPEKSKIMVLEKMSFDNKMKSANIGTQALKKHEVSMHKRFFSSKFC